MEQIKRILSAALAAALILAALPPQAYAAAAGVARVTVAAPMQPSAAAAAGAAPGRTAIGSPAVGALPPSVLPAANPLRPDAASASASAAQAATPSAAAPSAVSPQVRPAAAPAVAPLRGAGSRAATRRPEGHWAGPRAAAKAPLRAGLQDFASQTAAHRARGDIGSMRALGDRTFDVRGAFRAAAGKAAGHGPIGPVRAELQGPRVPGKGALRPSESAAGQPGSEDPRAAPEPEAGEWSGAGLWTVKAPVVAFQNDFLAVSPDGRYVAHLLEDSGKERESRLVVYDTRTRAIRRASIPPYEEIRGLAFDGQELVIAVAGAVLRLDAALRPAEVLPLPEGLFPQGGFIRGAGGRLYVAAGRADDIWGVRLLTLPGKTSGLEDWSIEEAAPSITDPDLASVLISERGDAAYLAMADYSLLLRREFLEFRSAGKRPSRIPMSDGLKGLRSPRPAALSDHLAVFADGGRSPEIVVLDPASGRVLGRMRLPRSMDRSFQDLTFAFRGDLVLEVADRSGNRLRWRWDAGPQAYVLAEGPGLIRAAEFPPNAKSSLLGRRAGLGEESLTWAWRGDGSRLHIYTAHPTRPQLEAFEELAGGRAWEPGISMGRRLFFLGIPGIAAGALAFLGSPWEVVGALASILGGFSMWVGGRVWLSSLKRTVRKARRVATLPAPHLSRAPEGTAGAFHDDGRSVIVTGREGTAYTRELGEYRQTSKTIPKLPEGAKAFHPAYPERVIIAAPEGVWLERDQAALSAAGDPSRGKVSANPTEIPGAAGPLAAASQIPDLGNLPESAASAPPSGSGDKISTRVIELPSWKVSQFEARLREAKVVYRVDEMSVEKHKIGWFRTQIIVKVEGDEQAVDDFQDFVTRMIDDWNNPWGE